MWADLGTFEVYYLFSYANWRFRSPYNCGRDNNNDDYDDDGYDDDENNDAADADDGDDNGAV